MGTDQEPNDDRLLRSLEEIRAEVPGAVRDLRKRPDLARAAAVDPVRAFEALGHRIDPALLPTVRRRVRFPLGTFGRLEELVAAVRDAAGRAVDVDDPDDLEHLLFTELQLPRPDEKGSTEHYRPTDPLPVDWGEPAPDPLEPLREAHSVMPPLLEYRRLEAGTPRLGDREAFRLALEGEGLYAVDSVTFVLQGRD